MIKSLKGIWTLEKYDRETGELVERKQKSNAITSAGRTEFLRLITGLSAAHYDNTSDLIIYDSDGGTQTRLLGGTQAGYPLLSTDDPLYAGTMSWRFADETANTYDANHVEFSNGSVVFSESTPNWGTKPTTQNWYYTYNLNIASTDAFVEEGDLAQLLQLFVGAISSHFNQANTSLRIYSNGTTVLGTFTDPMDAGYPAVSGSTATFQWTVPAGTLTGSWETVEVYESGLGSVLRGNPASETDGLTKQSTATWTVQFALTI